MATAPEDPLAALDAAISEASTIPEPQPYVPSSDPFARLRSRVRGVDESPPQTDAFASADRPAADGFDALVGREVLQMVQSRPLPAEARAEAVRRLMVALQNPTSDNVRSVLAVLVTGREDA